MPRGPPSERIVNNRWEVSTHKLGEGNYGKVYQGKDLTTGKAIAVKVTNMKILSKELQERLRGETDILTQINHPNIVKLYDQLQNGKYQLLMLEYMQGRDMHQLISDGKPIEMVLVMQLFGDLVEGLLELCKRNIIHRDLKPQNLLLTSTNPREAILKIADFGFARFLGPNDDMARTVAGSPLYMAPEVLGAAVGNPQKGYNTKADLYSAGVILYQMVQGEPPYTAMSQLDLLQKMKLNRRKPLPPTADPDLKKLLSRLLQPEPVHRISAEEFFNDPWVLKCIVTRPERAATQAAVAAAYVISLHSCGVKEDREGKGLSAWENILQRVSEATEVVAVSKGLDLQPPLLISLYMKATQLVSTAWNSIHCEKGNILCTVQKSEWDSVRKSLESMFLTYTESIDKLIVSPCCSPDTQLEPADSILFSQARDLCLRGTVEEMMHNTQTASSMYQQAHAMMKLVAADTSSAAHSIQRKTATRCLDMLSRRMKMTAR
eukprot:TRINITY_DN4945_c6_g1_i1.p1 TRINITY_DN4945_c6_g1~~TRINITY_DN4945_c6_g1_i1.p1  ORF type:complete len:491 (+),score=80.56 TRINITY_DN4945_c6_g1_i1:105-1577(+)